MADPRPYLKLILGFTEHPKIVEAGGDAGWLHVCALDYVARNRTDGFISTSMVPRLSDREEPKQLASRLVEANLWHEHGHRCETCPEVPPGQYLIHDYLEVQSSAEKIKTVSEQRRIAGQKGGKASGQSRRAASSKQTKQTRSKTEANLLLTSLSTSSSDQDLELEVQELKTSSAASKSEAKAKQVASVPAEDPAFCRFWDSYAYKVGKKEALAAWNKAIAGGAAPEAIIAGAARYAATRDPSLTTKFAQGWLTAERWTDEPPERPPPASTTDAKVAAGRALAAKLRAEEAAAEQAQHRTIQGELE